MTTFSDLGLSAPILKALESEGYTTPTPIQAQAIPTIMAGADLLGIAQTGTGKTAAFALPILHRLATDRKPALHKGCRVLVLSPTRELASQIADSFRTYGRHLGMTVTTIFGGVAHRPQIQKLARGVDILIATPGRLIDHLAERNLVLQGTEVLVLDEADQMLDLGFVKPIRRIVSQLSSRRQNLFFSATMPHEIAQLASELLQNPVKVAVAPVGTTVDRVAQRIIHVESRKKRSLLADLLADPGMSRTIVFTRTKRGADRVAQHLDTRGIRVAAIHGNKSQRQREEALGAFRASKIRVLVATDIAARGIDIDQVTHVVNYELPEVPEAYVHRIGRTARAGAAGIAISLCDVAERGLLRDIERLTRQSIPSEDRRNDDGLEADGSGQSDRAGRRPHGHGRPGSRDRGDNRGHPQGDPARSRPRPEGWQNRDANRGGSDDRRPRPAGDDRRPRPAGDDRRPHPVRDDRRPRPAGDDRRPRPAGDDRRPRPAGDDRRPRPAGDDRRPRPAGDDRRPRPAGDDRRPRPAGDDRRPRPAGDDRRPRPAGGGSGRPRFGGEGDRRKTGN